MRTLRVLRLSGAPYEMGYTHGKAFVDDIALLTEERIRLCTDPFWTGGRSASLAEVLALGKACLAEHTAFDADLMQEMQGMADATGLSVNELVIMNGFTDFVDLIANPRAARWAQEVGSQRSEVRPPTSDFRLPESLLSEDDCTGFIVEAGAAADGRAYIGQTWDMHASATQHVMMLDVQPAQGPALLAFTITGCVGMIGMNEAGVAVGMTNLLDAEGRIGVHFPYVVRKMLAQRTVDRALDVLLQAKLSGGHNYFVMGPDVHGALAGYNVEALATRTHVTAVKGFVTHTNHCLAPETQACERPRKALSLQSTTTRLSQAQRILASQQGAVTVDSLMAMTRHQEPGEMSICAVVHPTYDIESSGACIMSPTTRELWAVWGLPIESEYERFVVGAPEAPEEEKTGD